jgi:hypothetical protein
MTYQPTAIPTTSSPTHQPSGSENVFVCVSANVSMGFIENVYLYDSTSEAAMISGIASSMGIPSYDVRYDQDPSQLCPPNEEIGKHQYFFHLLSQ